MLQPQVSIRMEPDQVAPMVNLPQLPMVLRLALGIKIRLQMLAPLQGGMEGVVGVTSSSSLDPMVQLQQVLVGMVQAGGRVSMAPRQEGGVHMVSQPQTIEQATLP